MRTSTLNINVSRKKRLQDSIHINKFKPADRQFLRENAVIIEDYITIRTLVNVAPIMLWQLIHTKGSKESLVRDAYSVLKQRISEIQPELITVNNIKREEYKSKKKLESAIATGTIGTENSPYKRTN